MTSARAGDGGSAGASERLVNTECWGGDWPETLNTLVLTDGRTTMTCTVLYPSKEARAKSLGTGKKKGWSRSYDRLDEHFRTLAQRSDRARYGVLDGCRRRTSVMASRPRPR